METAEINQFKQHYGQEGLLISFEGRISVDMVNKLLKDIEAKLEESEEVMKKRRKVYNILVEMLQNLYHHIDSFDEMEGVASKEAVFLLASASEEYHIISGNYILNENVEGLKGKLEKINSLDKDGLRAHYQDVLNNGQYSIHGGGGLGMIDIARKSGNKLDFTFNKLNDQFSFFTLQVKV